MPKRIAILGSTGSIGESALKVVAAFNGDFKVAGLTTRRNIRRLEEQVKRFHPAMVGVVDPASFRDYSSSHGKNGRHGDRSPRETGLKIFGGTESLEKVATMGNVDLVLSGVVGAVGLKALLSALKMGRTVALANKESLIMAGELVTATARKYGARLLPVDSEHSAMFQCISLPSATGERPKGLHKIILTASGGPFYKFKGDLSKVTVEKALAHPNWVMGRKITVDSATLMNKGLEAIEAHYLFGVPLEKIQIVIHRQSIIHSAVEFEDGSILAQMSHPDMCLPIQYAMTYPERRPCPIPRLDFARMSRLDFAEPDFRKFPCLELALSAGKAGGTAPCALSAANEVAVHAFLGGKVKFTDIPRINGKVLGKHKNIKHPGLEDILQTDSWARKEARELC